MEQLIQFVKLFTLADQVATERLTARLEVVLRDPAAYETEYAEELLERGIEAGLPAQELRDVALIDALLSEELAWEADWQDEAADLVYGLNETLMQQGRTRHLDEPARGQATTTGPDALDIVQNLMEPMELALVLFTLDSDSYALSVVLDSQAEEARQLAAALGFTVAVY